MRLVRAGQRGFARWLALVVIVIGAVAAVPAAAGSSPAEPQRSAVKPLRFRVPVPLPGTATIGRKFGYSFCTPRPRGACDNRSSTNPTGGPGFTYVFEQRHGLPAGLRLDPRSGLLHGTVKRSVKPGSHRFRVCVTTTARAPGGDRPVVCLNTSLLVVADFSGTWSGTFSATAGTNSCSSTAHGNVTLTLSQRGTAVSGNLDYQVTGVTPKPNPPANCLNLPPAGTIPLSPTSSGNTLSGSGFTLTLSGPTLSGTFVGTVQGIDITAQISTSR